MSDVSQRTEPLTAQQVLERVKTVDGVGSGLDADLTVTPVSRSGSFGGYPSASTAAPMPFPDVNATLSRFSLGI